MHREGNGEAAQRRGELSLYLHGGGGGSLGSIMMSLLNMRSGKKCREPGN